jgi:hypothetical protein
MDMMETKELMGNTLTMGGVFAYLMSFQAEITLLLLLTGLFINIVRIYDRFRKNRKL